MMSDLSSSDGVAAGGRWKYAPRVVSRYAVGVDLGQSVDFTAISVVEARTTWVVGGHSTAHRPTPTEYRLRYLERRPLGESYPDQARALLALLSAEGLGSAAVIVDRSGVGRGVFDLLKDMGLRRAVGIVITGADGESRDGQDFKVGKLPLVSQLQARLHDGSLKIARALPLAAELVRELSSFRVQYSGTGHLGFGGRSGTHDDLVLSLALAVWWLRRETTGRAEFVKLSGI